MITTDKLRIYEKFDGDIDGFARGGSTRERELIEDSDWLFIDKLRQALTIVQSGNATPEFEEEASRQLADAAPDENVRESLRTLSMPKIRPVG